MEFIPTVEQEPVVPFYEDSSEEKIPGWRTRKTHEQLQKELKNLLMELGAGLIVFTPGAYPTVPKRWGYRITFSLNGIPGRIDCAALPMRSEAKVKKDRAMAQGLWLLVQELQAQVNAWIYKPGSVPLIPYLIGPGGRTVTEELTRRGILPDIKPVGYLPAPK